MTRALPCGWRCAHEGHGCLRSVHPAASAREDRALRARNRRAIAGRRTMRRGRLPRAAAVSGEDFVAQTTRARPRDGRCAHEKNVPVGARTARGHVQGRAARRPRPSTGRRPRRARCPGSGAALGEGSAAGVRRSRCRRSGRGRCVPSARGRAAAPAHVPASTSRLPARAGLVDPTLCRPPRRRVAEAAARPRLPEASTRPPAPAGGVVCCRAMRAL